MEDQSTIRTMWYPVRERVSIRQESQFKLTVRMSDSCGPNVGASYMVNYRFDFNRPDIYLSWSERTHIRYGNCVLKFSRPDAHSLWSGHAKPVMEITCSGRTSVQTIEPSRPDKVLIQKRFLREFFRKSCRTVVRPNDPCPPSGWCLGYFSLTLI